MSSADIQEQGVDFFRNANLRWPEHLARVRLLPCCLCLIYSRDVEAHHLCISDERGVGLKASDKWAVPLCRAHHNEVHTHGTRHHGEWFYENGVDDVQLATALWTASVELRDDRNKAITKMRAIVMKHDKEERENGHATKG